MRAAGPQPICCSARPALPGDCRSPGASAWKDYPATDPKHPERSFKGVDGKTTYSEGVNVGYRWFDKEKIAPLFAFGHGLSYTTFAYSGLKVEKAADGGLDVSVTSRTPAVWIQTKFRRSILARRARFPLECSSRCGLWLPSTGFTLTAGEAKTVTLHVPPRQLQYWSTKEGKWVTATGKRTVSVGASSRDLRLNQTID